MLPSKKYRPDSRRAAIALLSKLSGAKLGTVEKWVREGDFMKRMTAYYLKKSGLIVIERNRNINQAEL